jgi:hypothetical protein
MIKYLSIAIIFFSVSACFTFNPRSSRLSLIIVSATLEKDEPLVNELIDPGFDKVTLFRGEKEITYSEKSGHFYYFQNLPPGQYELGNLIHLLNKGNAGHPIANNHMPQKIEPPLTRDDRMKTIVNVEPGSIHFLGEVQVKANITVKNPVDISASFSKSIEAEKRAMNHLMRNYPRSGWAELAKDRLKSLNVINLE